MEERRRRRMRRRFFLLFSNGGGCGCGSGSGAGGSGGGVTGAPSTASATRAFRRAERVAAGAGARDICDVRAGSGIVLVVLAEGVHAAHRGAGALAAGVRVDVVVDVRGGGGGGGGARELGGVEVGVSAQFGGAEERELWEVKVDGFVAERQERFEARGRRRVELDGVREGCGVVGC